MKQSEVKQFTSWLGKRSYKARLARLGLERLQEIARENGKLVGDRGAPPRSGRKAAIDGRLQARQNLVVQIQLERGAGPGKHEAIEQADR